MVPCCLQSFQKRVACRRDWAAESRFAEEPLAAGERNVISVIGKQDLNSVDPESVGRPSQTPTLENGGPVDAQGQQQQEGQQRHNVAEPGRGSGTRAGLPHRHSPRRWMLPALLTGPRQPLPWLALADARTPDVTPQRLQRANFSAGDQEAVLTCTEVRGNNTGGAVSTSPSSLLGGRLVPERDASSECGPQGEDLVGKERHFSLQICSVPRERPGLPFLQDFAQSWSGKCSSSATTQASFSQDGLYPEDSGLRQSVREGWREEPGRGPGRPELPAGSSAGSHDTPGSNHWLHVCQEAEHVLFAGVDGSRPSMALHVVVAAFSDCCGILIIIEASGKKQPWCGAGAVAAPLGLAELFLLQRPLQPLPGWSRAARRTSRITGARGTAHRTRPPGELKVRDHQEAVLAGLALCPILFQQNTCPLLHVVQL
uniref:uncharacterized protein LOC118519903 n=1 Tax=Halichoerus grypus TaxID=9711 RepID=UPI001659BF1D|nr:uncharacterized protein LOC118519903 [Halichoerus grypus]